MNEYKYEVSTCLQNTILKMGVHEISSQIQSKLHIWMLTFASKAIKMSKDRCLTVSAVHLNYKIEIQNFFFF